LLDLSRDQARAIFLKQLEDLIGLGADWIWSDFNTAPRSIFWDSYESRDRKGLLELGFYQGLYRVFDALLERYPNVWLETCASGGRLIDLGILRRSHSIWVNDASQDDDANRNLRGGANALLPAVSIQNGIFLNKDILSDPIIGGSLGGGYRFLTSFGGNFQFGQGLCYWNASDLREARRYVERYKEFRKYLEKDYYHLLPMPRDRAAWDGWQYHDTATDSGILLVFRMKDSAEDRKLIRPRTTKALNGYRWSVVLGDAAVEMHGQELSISMSAPNAVLVHYFRG
jgi:alpha-galactosidase